MIILSDCRNVLIRDVTLSNAPNWTLHLQGPEQVVISGIHIKNDVLIPNNDGTIACVASTSMFQIRTFERATMISRLFRARLST